MSAATMDGGSDLLTMREIADRLRVSTFTVDRMIKQGKLRPLSLSGKVKRIPAAQVEALIADAMVAA